MTAIGYCEICDCHLAKFQTECGVHDAAHGWFPTRTDREPSSIVLASKGRPARYVIRWDSIDTNRYDYNEKIAAQAKIAAKIAHVDAHPHRDPAPWKPVDYRAMPTASQVAAATARSSMYRVQMSEDEIAETELADARIAEQAAAFVAQVEPIAPATPVATVVAKTTVALPAPTGPCSNPITRARYRRAYETALANEIRAVDALPERANKVQIAACWAKAEKTNRALRALRVAEGLEQPAPQPAPRPAPVSIATPVVAIETSKKTRRAEDPMKKAIRRRRHLEKKRIAMLAISVAVAS